MKLIIKYFNYFPSDGLGYCDINQRTLLGSLLINNRSIYSSMTMCRSEFNKNVILC